MAKLIGKHFRIKLDSTHLLRAIKRASKQLIKEFPKYADINGKEVILVAKEYETNVKVVLAEKKLLKDDYWLVLSNRWLAPISNNCNCTTKILMCRGCMCGAFRQEQVKTEQDDAKQELPPW
jgi:hypothetical protein